MAFQGSLRELPLADVIQVVAVSGKSGVFTVKNDRKEGYIYLQDGEIVHAQVEDLEGEDAIYELAIWSEGEFVFTPDTPSPKVTITRSITNLLMEAARRADEWRVLSKKIPSTHLVPIFKHRNSMTSVTLSPQEWIVVSRIDEQKTIDEISLALGVSSFEVCKVIYGLITSGLIELNDYVRTFNAYLNSLDTDALVELINSIYQKALEYVGQDEKHVKLITNVLKMSYSQIETGRGGIAGVEFLLEVNRLLDSIVGKRKATRFFNEVKAMVGA